MRASIGSRHWQWPVLSVLSLVLLGCGGGGGSSSSSGSSPTPTWQLSLLAGSTSGAGNLDGMGSVASFTHPGGVAKDAQGNFYVTDSDNCTIRKMVQNGSTWMVSTFAGLSGACGYADGTGSGARFMQPTGIAIDSNGVLYVVDDAGTVIRKITAQGVVSTWAGQAGVTGSANGTGAQATFNGAQSLAVDTSTDTVSKNVRNDIYVADTGNNEIRKITSTGAVSTFAGQTTAGSTDSKDGSPSFNAPKGIAVDASSNIYVADTSNHTIRLITPSGTVSTLAGTKGKTGAADQVGTSASFNLPTGLAFYANTSGSTTITYLYVADTGNDLIRQICVTSTGCNSSTTNLSYQGVNTMAGIAGIRGWSDGAGAQATFESPVAVATDNSGNILIIDNTADSIRLLSQGTVSTIAGQGLVYGILDGIGAGSSFGTPLGMAADASGNLYVAEYSYNTLRKVASDGTVTTLAGFGAVVPTTEADGKGPDAKLMGPAGVTIDAAGNLFFTDYAGDTVRKMASDGTVTTIAGQPTTAGSADGSGTAAGFNAPYGIAIDTSGNLYVADSKNQTIRKISGNVVTTIAGQAGQSGYADGQGSSARFNTPIGVAVDISGNIYVADAGNQVIRKITASGAVTTFAGSGTPGAADGQGTTATFNQPALISIDSSGNLLVADRGNGLIRKVTATGAVSTVLGKAGQLGATLGALTSATLPRPNAVVSLANGQIAVSANQGILETQLK